MRVKSNHPYKVRVGSGGAAGLGIGLFQSVVC
jgi:hypothetical protein